MSYSVRKYSVLKTLNQNYTAFKMTNKTKRREFEKILLEFSKKDQNNELAAAIIDTPIGELFTVGNEKSIYMLQVLQKESLYLQLKRITDHTKSYMKSGRTKAIDMLERELTDYFNGTLEVFTTPIQMFGTDFQVQVWKALRKIPFGKQISYAQLAENVQAERPKTSAGAKTPVKYTKTNGANRIMIVIPCHRVINKNGKLGGFSCGIEKKRLLLDLENKLL